MAYISLITLGVHDIARATQFYEALGWEKSTYSVDGVVSFLRGGTVALALYGKDALSTDAKTPAAASYAVNVDSPAAVDDALARASGSGATITSPGTAAEWGGYVGYFTDPDGHLWEVAHNPDFPLDDDGRVYLPGFEAAMQEQILQSEAQIEEFIGGAGEAVDVLVTASIEAVRTAYDEIARLLADQPNNTVVATMLALGQRARRLESTDSDHWVSNATSTLVSALIN